MDEIATRFTPPAVLPKAAPEGVTGDDADPRADVDGAAAAPQPAADRARLRVSEMLTAIAEAPDERLTLGEVLGALGDRTFGFVLLVLAVICVLPQPPFGTTVFGTVLTLIALQLLIGLSEPWVPGFIRRRSMARATFRLGIGKVVPTLRRIERVCRPRFSWLTTGLFERLAGFTIAVFAFIIALPIPVVGNVLPGIAVAVIAIGLIEQDGLALLAGVAFGLAALALIVAVVGGAAVALF